MNTVDSHMHQVLTEAIKIVFPLDVNPDTLIKPHVWRDRKYVGEFNGKVNTWRGLSANLSSVDFRYRTVFVDLVENNLPLHERNRLFGQQFADAISTTQRFVVMFVLDFPLDAIKTIGKEGFVPRLMAKVAHACTIADEHEFLRLAPSYWAAKIARLVLLQRVLSTRRKPLDANEVPFQNLLYRTGYLHSYLVQGGLHLYELSKPRRAGDFGHDLHAVVGNPHYLNDSPFDLGIEVFMGALGYHAQSIPEYVRYFNLRGMVVISKDDPMLELKKRNTDFGLPLAEIKEVSQIGNRQVISIHHLPFERIISDFDRLRSEIDELIPNFPIYLK